MSPLCFRSLWISFAALAIIINSGSAFTIGRSNITESSEQIPLGSNKVEVKNDLTRADDNNVTVSTIKLIADVTKPNRVENVTLNEDYPSKTAENPSKSLEVLAALTTTLDDSNTRVINNIKSTSEVQNVTSTSKSHTEIINEINALQEITIDTTFEIETGTDKNNLNNMFYDTTQLLGNKNSTILYVTPEGRYNSTIMIEESMKNDKVTKRGDSDSAETILHAVNLTEVPTTELPRTTTSRKTYLEIGRKHTKFTVSDLTTESGQTEVTTNSAATNNTTRVSLEDTISRTSEKSSLENLKNNFLLFTTKLSTETEPTVTLIIGNSTSNEIFQNDTITELTTELNIQNEITANKNESRILNHGMIGGYINIPTHTTTMYSTEETSTQKEPETYGSIFEHDLNEADAKTTRGVEFRNMMEDAIKEELLKEEILKDNIENADKRPTLTSTPANAAKDITTTRPQERSRNMSVYTVNSNYKPMKKIDVQPPKPFVRNPDDNSWRNESLSSLGITFNAHNSSKTFTQVLRNKTEVELKNIMELEKENKSKENKNELRKRLEEIAEKRKSKKKKFDGTSSDYGDYGELNAPNELNDASQPEAPSDTITTKEEILTKSFSKFVTSPLITTTLRPTTTSTVKPKQSSKFTTYDNSGYLGHSDYFTTLAPKKLYFSEYNDDNEQSDVDYVTGIDLKRFTFPMHTKNTPNLSMPITETMGHYLLDRKPTVQYFPPTSRTKQKVNVNDYDLDFQRKVNAYTTKMFPPASTVSVDYATKSPVLSKDKIKLASKIANYAYNPEDLNRELYFSGPQDMRPHHVFTVGNQENVLDENAYIMKSYGNYFQQVAKAQIDEASPEYIPTFTQPPIRGVTINDEAKTKEKVKGDEYDYEMQFRKDILDRFIDNFNQNSDGYKVDFPIVYNNSVVHKKAEEGGKVVASSSAFMRRLFSPGHHSDYFQAPQSCPPSAAGCGERDNMTVELAPAYELHYYVPDQEEKEEMDMDPR